MKVFSVDLAKHYQIQSGTLHCLVAQNAFDIPADWKRPAVIVVPGGAYSSVSKREGFPVAQAFLARGFQTFVLNYSTVNDGAKYPTQLVQLACAVDYVRKNASELKVCAHQIFVVGFSAGGHLTGNLAVEWQNVTAHYGSPLDCKPTAVGLCYPVISQNAGYAGTHQNLLKGYSDVEQEQLLNKLNLDQAVGVNTPPTFLWTTAQDGVVPSQNSLLFALALANNKIPYELHVYPCGEHGLSTCTEEINPNLASDCRRNGQWLDDCSAFFHQFCAKQF